MRAEGAVSGIEFLDMWPRYEAGVTNLAVSVSPGYTASWSRGPETDGAVSGLEGDNEISSRGHFASSTSGRLTGRFHERSSWLLKHYSVCYDQTLNSGRIETALRQAFCRHRPLPDQEGTN